mgnify:CR=1 FL=1
MIRSLVYADSLVTRIPGPFDISRSAYGSNPQVNALFGSANDIETLFAHSRALHGYFSDWPGCERVYVPLAMYRQEKKTLGMALDGDIMRRDVTRTAVNFSGHRLGVCAASEAQLRDKLRWRGIHNLAVTALATDAPWDACVQVDLEGSTHPHDGAAAWARGSGSTPSSSSGSSSAGSRRPASSSGTESAAGSSKGSGTASTSSSESSAP